MSSSAVPIDMDGKSSTLKGANDEQRQRKRKIKSGNTSDESEGDEENIILVESPSSLFRHHRHHPSQ